MREMKESGIDWLGKIPETWDIIKAKNVFNHHKIIVGDKQDEFDRLSLTLKGVIKREKNDSKGLQVSDFKTYQILKKNELVFKMIDLTNVSTSRVGFSKYTGIVSPVYIILTNEKYSKFGYYYFLNMWQREIFNKLGNDGVRSAINARDMLNLPFPKITETEAYKIAEILDKKIFEIDKVIEKTKETIEDYKKYKQSIITETVTRGLDKNAEMKDTGIECIGKIPKHWQIKRNKYIATSLQKGNGITKDEVFENGDIQCVRYGEIYSSYNNTFNKTFSRTNFDCIKSPKKIEKGDILFAGTGELVEEIGKNILYLGNEECLAGGDIIVMKHNQESRFLNYSLNSIISQEQKSNGKAKLKVVHISSTDIGNIVIPIPPLEEQEKIANYLDEIVYEINNIIASKQNIITELEEYKKSLIYEYVTGKKEVI